MQFCLEPGDRAAIWALHFLNAGSQAIINGDIRALGLGLTSQQGPQGALWGNACVCEKGRPSRAMT